LKKGIRNQILVCQAPYAFCGQEEKNDVDNKID